MSERIESRKRNSERRTTKVETINGNEATHWEHKFQVTAATPEWFLVKGLSAVPLDGREPHSSFHIYVNAGMFTAADLVKCRDAIDEVLDWSKEEAIRGFPEND